MRLANRVLAALLSLALIVIGVLLVIGVVADRLGNRTAGVNWHPAYAWAGRTTWESGALRVACAVLIVLGLILLIAELKPARASRIAAAPGDAGAAGINTAYTRRGVAAAIKLAVSDLDGVRGAAVKVRRRKVTIGATSVFLDKADADDLRQSIAAAAGDRLAKLSLRRSPSVSVHVTTRSR